MVDRMIFGKCWPIEDDIKARASGERVFWDRFWGIAKHGCPRLCQLYEQ